MSVTAKERDLSAFWLYPDWNGPLKEPFWMRPLKMPDAPDNERNETPARDWRFGGALVAYEARHGKKGLAEYRAMLERIAARPERACAEQA